MAGRLLIIDEGAINRIMLSVRLSQLSYQVGVHAAIDEMPQSAEVDAVILCGPLRGAAGATRMADLRSRLAAGWTPVIALLPEGASPAEALAAGADDALPLNANPAELVARLRGLTRSARSYMDSTCGIPPELFAAFEKRRTEGEPGQVLVLGATEEIARQARNDLMRHLPYTALPVCWSGAVETMLKCSGPTVILMYVTDENPFPAEHTLVALRSARRTGDAAVLGMFDAPLEKQAIDLLNMGADDIYIGPAAPVEIGLRVTNLMRRTTRQGAQRSLLAQSYTEAMTDTLTGLQNRRGGLSALARLWEQMKREGGDLAVMIADVDHFKRINDTFGHGAGDEALIEVSRRLHAVLPSGGTLARIGGEEFLVACPVSGPDAAAELAEELRHAVSSVPVALGAGLPAVRITMSVGVQMMAGIGAGVEEALNDADLALYAAKSAGRNLVRLGRPGAC